MLGLQHNFNGLLSPSVEQWKCAIAFCYQHQMPLPLLLLLQPPSLMLSIILSHSHLTMLLLKFAFLFFHSANTPFIFHNISQFDATISSRYQAIPSISYWCANILNANWLHQQFHICSSCTWMQIKSQAHIHIYIFLAYPSTWINLNHGRCLFSIHLRLFLAIFVDFNLIVYPGETRTHHLFFCMNSISCFIRRLRSGGFNFFSALSRSPSSPHYSVFREELGFFMAINQVVYGTSVLFDCLKCIANVCVVNKKYVQF